MPNANVPSLRGLIGSSAVMQQLSQRVATLALSDATVLLLGETGTGKEVVARALHENSPRAQAPFVVVNCAGLAASLVESELFGHLKGSFTGADRDHLGCFEAANGGTLFLDEIGDAPPEVQTRLLRVLQERRVTRVGSSEARPVDVRVIAATHHALEQEALTGRFRSDLFHRLAVVTIDLPSLRDRLDDLDELAAHFLLKRTGPASQLTLSADVTSLLRSYRYPGNVRELELMIAGAAAELPNGGTVELAHLRIGRNRATAKPAPASTHALWDQILTLILQVGVGLGWTKLKEELLNAALRLCGGNQSAAAKLLGINRSTLLRLLGTPASEAASAELEAAKA